MWSNSTRTRNWKSASTGSRTQGSQVPANPDRQAAGVIGKPCHNGERLASTCRRPTPLALLRQRREKGRRIVQITARQRQAAGAVAAFHHQRLVQIVNRSPEALGSAGEENPV